MKRSLHTIILRVAIAVVSILAYSAFDASALPTSHYAKSSVLSSGKWVRVRVDKTGMQIITAAQLKNYGFSDISKVNVYGYGGRLISELLNDKQIDDLPIQPCIRTDRGIMFFGVNSVRWQRTSNSPRATTPTFYHEIHAYEDASYYYLSDRVADDVQIEKSAAVEPGAEIVNTFIERQLHEQELAYPTLGATGRQVLGEDFRTTTQRTFPFTLADNVGDVVKIETRFVARSSASSSYSVRAGGKTLGSSTIPGSADKNDYATGVKSNYTLSGIDNKLDVTVDFKASGQLYFANLDYIKVEYMRDLRLADGQLYFYVPSVSHSTVEISGCSAETRIWDVTDAAAPKEVEFTLSGDVARFGQENNIYREYVAFDASKVATAPVSAGSVANQDIHSLPTPDMLIIAPQPFIAQAERVAEMRRRVDGFVVHVLTPAQLYNEFSSGTRDVSAFRKALKMWYDRGDDNGHSIRYCLIFGRPTFDNKMVGSAKGGVERVPIWQKSPDRTSKQGFNATTRESHTSSYSTDDIIGMLEDTKGSTFSITAAKVNVSVGRMPVKTVAEATTAVDKLIKYVEQPVHGSWRNSILMIADDQNNGEHALQTNRFYDGVTADAVGASYDIERLMFDNYPIVPSSTGMTYPGPRARFQEKLAEGAMLMVYIGHGCATSLSHEGFFTWNDIISMNNSKLPIFFTFTCEFGPWEEENVTAAEEVWLNPTSGFIALLTTSRTVLISSNGTFTRMMGPGMLARDEKGNQKRLGDVYRLAKNKVTDDNKLRYTIIGDPALRFPGPQADAVVDKIDGVDLASAGENLPELKARGRAEVEGRIVDIDGNTDTSFNGTIELSLYDAEKVVTTLGNIDGEPVTYNDRTTRLFRCTARVDSGYWKTSVLLPVDIENNYSPGKIVLYAYSDKGLEANGHTDKFYVYGFDENAPEDIQGPEIKRFTLNSDAFRDGGAVSSTPLVLADLTDDSGINISSLGIGHSMSLTLDGKREYSDVANYFVPTNGDPTSGSISYLMPQIEPGDHTLDLQVWDNAGNSSKATLRFSVGAHGNTVIYGLTTDKNPASTSVVFMLTAEQPEPGTECILEVFDLSGRKIWSHTNTISGVADSNVQVKWDLRDSSGHRIPRGIYLYRATVKNSKGVVDSSTKKLAVTAAGA